MRLVFLVTAAAVAVGCASASAQNVDGVKARQKAFETMGKANKPVGAMLKGEAPFELATVQTALKTFQEQAGKMKDLHGDDTKTGGDTAALPGVWEKKSEYLALFDKFAADAKLAEVSIKDEASLKAGWPKLTGENCGGCHKVYKKKDG